VDDEQLYVYGFQVVGHTNADANCHTYTDSDRYSYTNAYCYSNGHTDARYRCGGYDQPAIGVNLYFVQRDFYLERGQRDRLLPFRRQFATWRGYLQLRNSDGAIENREQHPYGWAHDLCNARFAG